MQRAHEAIELVTDAPDSKPIVGYDVRIFACSEAAAVPVRTALADAGFAADVFNSVGKNPSICVGGAPLALCAYLKEIVERLCDGKLQIERIWPLASREIHIHLPEAALDADSLAKQSRRAPRQPRPFIRACGGEVIVGRSVLARRSPRALPRRMPEKFAEFCIDRTTAASLQFMAESVAPREALILEGETGVSKTAAAEYFAHLLGQKVYRINLHGHTDNAELTGRYIPEGQGFAFVEQALPRAMREGAILLLDEVNLAESAVVERMNSALDNPPSLRLTEADSREIAGADVSPDFQVIATANPISGYAGRSEHSPAFLNRFTFWHVPKPDEQDIAHLLHFLATGEQPDIEVEGIEYAGFQTSAPLPALAYMPSRDRVFEALARFHIGADDCLGKTSGATRARRHLTRRQLLSAMRALNREPGTDADQWAERLFHVIRRYYLSVAAASPEVYGSMFDLFHASGFGEERWSFPA